VRSAGDAPPGEPFPVPARERPPRAGDAAARRDGAAVRPLRVTVVLPFTGLTGGTRVLVEYASGLHARGHRVTLVYPWHAMPPAGAAGRLKGLAKGVVNLACRAMGRWEIRWMPPGPPLRALRRLDDAHLPDADVLLASEVHTVAALEDVSPAKGRKVYLVQGHETWAAPDEVVDATWRSPAWVKLAVASWLAELARDRYQSYAAVVRNGVDLQHFHPQGRREHDPPRVLSLHSALPFKGTADAVEAMRRVRERGIAFRPVFFGTARPRRELDMLPGAEFVHFPRGERLRRLYTGASVYLLASRAEGFGLTGLEAAACGVPLVATRVGGVPEYAVHGRTALVVEPGDVDGLADALAALLQDPVRRVAFSRAGLCRAREFSLETSLLRLERLLGGLAGAA
jgi:glycosyltransferase involved in cell wall biosynthesis